MHSLHPRFVAWNLHIDHCEQTVPEVRILCGPGESNILRLVTCNQFVVAQLTLFIVASNEPLN